jgi:hypothetical protein
MLAIIAAVLLGEAPGEAGMGNGTPPSAAAPTPECRESTFTTADGRRGSMRYCKGADGLWHRTGGQDAPQPPFPPRSQVTFKGAFSGKITTAGPAMRKFDLGSLLASAGTQRPLDGALTISLRVDGKAGYATVSGTGGISFSNLSGLVQDGSCRLANPQATVTLEGRCSRAGFKGRLSGQSTTRESFDFTVDAPLDSLRDY